MCIFFLFLRSLTCPESLTVSVYVCSAETCQRSAMYSTETLSNNEHHSWLQARAGFYLQRTAEELLRAGRPQKQGRWEDLEGKQM